jgi:antitoxin component YwqK of YwqJK toxin-antitoxin module
MVADGEYCFVVETPFYPLRYEGIYRDGMREGLWRVFREDSGVRAWETTWANGVWHGPSRSWWPSGHIEEEGAHRGLGDGVWRFCFENGQLAAEGRYVAGVKRAGWRYWDEDGADMKYEAWAERYEHWDWAHDDCRGFPHGENWPAPPGSP